MRVVIAWIAGETRHAGQEASESQPLVPAQGEGSCRLFLHKNDIGIAELHWNLQLLPVHGVY